MTVVCVRRKERDSRHATSITHHVGGENCLSPLLVTLAATHLTQAAQNLDGDVPLIAGRPALLRVFVTAHRESGAGLMPVRLSSPTDKKCIGLR